MKKDSRVWPLIMTVAGVLVCLVFGSCKRDPAPEKKEVVLYCSADQSIAEPIIAEFERLSGIKVLARYDWEANKTRGLVEKIRAESAGPGCDVFWSSEIFHTIRLADDGLLGRYESEEAANRPDALVDDEGRWYGFGLRVRVIAYNTNKVSEAESPRSLEDALDSKWKGRILMARPEFGTTSGDVSSWFVHYGEEGAVKILRGLKDNEIRLVDGNSMAVRMVAAGQADICFTDTDDVYAAQRNGWPMKMNYLDQGGDGPLVIPNTAAVIKGGPNPGQAKVLMDFLLSERLEEMLVESDSHNCPVHRRLAEKYKAYSVARPLDVDYAEVAGKMASAIRTAREILR